MITITDIKAGQQWGFKNIKRGDIIISHVNVSNNTVYWSYVDYNSNVFDSPYERFISDFIPRDESLLDQGPKPGKNEDRDFLI